MAGAHARPRSHQTPVAVGTVGTGSGSRHGQPAGLPQGTETTIATTTGIPMRELDLETHTEAHAPAPVAGQAAGGEPLAVALIGAGRAGRSFAHGLRGAGYRVIGPLGRGEHVPDPVDVVLICVPDAAVESVAAGLADGPIVGHCCGSHGLELLPQARSFCLHPLMTLTGEPNELAGAFAAVDATDQAALATARRVAGDLGMTAVEIAAEDRAAYHAAASIASNFLLTLESAAEALAASAGLPRDGLVPLVERTVANWAASGAERSLTGPVARGDNATVARQRAQVETRLPEFLPLFDELCVATERLAAAGARP